MTKRRNTKKRAKSKSPGLLVGVLAALLVISIGYIVFLSTSSSTPLSVGEVRQAPSGESYFVAPFGFAEQDVLRVEGLQTIVLGIGCDAIVADTSPERAAAIRDGLAGRVSGRPNAYDQWSDMLATYGITLEAVTVHDFSGQMYLATGVFRQDTSVLEIDMRPSDGIALAARTGSPVYISRGLLNRFGEDIC